MSGAPISRAEVKELCARINALPVTERVSWALIEQFAIEITNRTFSRQTLCTHKSIKKAYEKKVFAQRDFKRTGRPKRVPTSEERVKLKLRADIESLRETLEKYDRRLLAIVEYCTLKGLDVRMIFSLSPLQSPGATAPRRNKVAGIRNGKGKC